MENQILDSDFTSGKELILNSSAKEYLRQTAKWAFLLAIITIIFSVLVIIVGLFFGSIMGLISNFTMPNTSNIYAGAVGVFMSIFYGAIGLVMMYPGIRLLQFCSKTKQALNTNSTETIEESLKRLRSVFRFYGIIIIMYLVLIVLTFATIGIGALR